MTDFVYATTVRNEVAPIYLGSMMHKEISYPDIESDMVKHHVELYPESTLSVNINKASSVSDTLQLFTYNDIYTRCVSVYLVPKTKEEHALLSLMI